MFALYFTAQDAASGRQCIGVATASSPAGPFRDASAQPLVCQVGEGGSIDASPFQDADGTRYLLWKNDGNCCNQATNLYLQPLSADGLRLTGKASTLIQNFQLWEGAVIEAPTLYHAGGVYYLLYSAGPYDSDLYAVGYATAPRVTGPYKKAPENPILVSRGEVAGPGHQTVVTDGAGRTWLAYHAWTAGRTSDAAGGYRSLRLDPVSCAGGRVKVTGPTVTPQRAPAPLPAGPLYPGDFADPFVLNVDGTYYAYGTGLHGRAGGLAFEALSSPDLIHWTSHGGVLTPLGPERRDHWAPEIARREQTFYLYHSVGHGDQGHHLRVATAAHPLGPFEDLGLNLTPDELFAIDPHPFQAPDGAWWLFFARDDLGGERPGTVLAVAPLHDMTRLGEARTILRASGDWQRYQRERAMYGGVHDWHTLEGPFVVWRAGRFQLLYSGGAWVNETYGAGHAVADHPLGPWTEPVPGACVLRTAGSLRGPGHASVTARGGQDVLVFHAWDALRTRRQLYAAPLFWREGRPCTEWSGGP
ncbi:family 43 glycosylhydrolase [Deinococcus aerophilus]|uniref:Glycoside hydrolase n=1 Tax=Deinococcus aerophilus TaxID=522488 RepID=A0ABQ2GXF8_9DEIO|nr:family 43 glycosylhydrolase [Deinococcus aerophilus]GGM16851.1 hypothetical protein GCM10010841_26440 [Deinococcus aerophilus]